MTSKFFFDYFSEKVRLDISCELSVMFYCMYDKGDPPRGFADQRNIIYFRGTRGNSINEENRGTKAVLGNREHRKSRS